MIGIATALALVIATGTLILSLAGPYASDLSFFCTNVDHSLLTLFLWIILVDLASKSSANAFSVFAIGWTLRSVPFWLSSCFTRLFGVTFSPLVCTVVIYICVVAVVLVLVGHNANARHLLSDLYGKVQSNADSIEHKCMAIEKRYKLTPRETEVLISLSQGQSRPYIAEMLGLSENTVRGYTKSLYKKLDIHNRQDLFLLVDNTPPDEGGAN